MCYGGAGWTQDCFCTAFLKLDGWCNQSYIALGRTRRRIERSGQNKVNRSGDAVESKVPLQWFLHTIGPALRRIASFQKQIAAQGQAPKEKRYACTYDQKNQSLTVYPADRKFAFV